jgi:hypothetical protein
MQNDAAQGTIGRRRATLIGGRDDALIGWQMNSTNGSH